MPRIQAACYLDPPGVSKGDLRWHTNKPIDNVSSYVSVFNVCFMGDKGS